MQPNKHFTEGMVKVAILGWLGTMANKAKTVGYNVAAPAAKKAGKFLFTKVDPKSGARRFSLGRTALTGLGAYGAYRVGKQMLGNASSVGGRDYMDDFHPHRQSDTLRVAQ
jgi:hypothetical protein